ncbi:hypothetical protein J6590_054167 [Homalodisca vitripennis]|nr:hypothetical protein J6590_054167 [Homalodisca vitripennis]
MRFKKCFEFLSYNSVSFKSRGGLNEMKKTVYPCSSATLVKTLVRSGNRAVVFCVKLGTLQTTSTVISFYRSSAYLASNYYTQYNLSSGPGPYSALASPRKDIRSGPVMSRHHAIK